jgi:phytol kinase
MDVLLCAVGFVAILAAGEVAHRVVGIDGEHTRRLVHIASGSFAASLPWILTWDETVALSLAFAALMALSKWQRILLGIHDVARQTWGEVCFPVGVVAVAIVEPPRPYYAFGVLAMALGDGLAGLIGRDHGRHPFRIGLATKTLEGSVTCFAVTTGLAVCVLSAAQLLEDAQPASIALVAVVSASAVTAVEAVTPLGFDNLLVPIVGCLTLWGLVALAA